MSHTPTRPISTSASALTPNGSQSQPSGFQIPTYVFDDLCSRFIINIPEEERQDLIRIFFQIELAHWFYLDFYCQETPSLKACGIKDFSAQIFRHCPTLIVHADNVDKILESWRGYKMAVPTYGAIMLDPSLQFCLLVQGYWSKANWGFPKGKVNEDEVSYDCAIREVFEETGFDISNMIDKDEYIEFKMNEQISRLYIIPGVSMETKFAPRTRKEIRKLDWFRIDQIPAHKKDIACKTHYNLPPNAFFMVIPFVKPLRKWVARRLGRTPELGESDSSLSGSFRGRSKSGEADGSQGASSRRQRSKSQCAESSDPSANTEKQRQKQQQHFQQQIQNDFLEYMSCKNLKTPKGSKDQRTRSASPSAHNQKGHGRSQVSSPKQHKKQLQILKRDGTTSGSTPRKSLSAQFNSTSDGGGQGLKRSVMKTREGPFGSETWMNFRLDIDAVMSAYSML